MLITGPLRLAQPASSLCSRRHLRWLGFNGLLFFGSAWPFSNTGAHHSLPLALLQSWQHATRFLSRVAPPLCQGFTWSRLAVSLVNFTRQYRQRFLSRLRMRPRCSVSPCRWESSSNGIATWIKAPPARAGDHAAVCSDRPHSTTSLEHQLNHPSPIHHASSFQTRSSEYRSRPVDE